VAPNGTLAERKDLQPSLRGCDGVSTRCIVRPDERRSVTRIFHGRNVGTPEHGGLHKEQRVPRRTSG